MRGISGISGFQCCGYSRLIFRVYIEVQYVQKRPGEVVSQHRSLSKGPCAQIVEGLWGLGPV